MKYFSKFIDIEITTDFSYGKHIKILFLGRVVAHFYIEHGSTEIKRN